MPITQEEIDRGDIVDPELIEQAQADLDKNDDDDPTPIVDEDDEEKDDDNDDEDGDDKDEDATDEDEDEDSGEGDSDEEDEEDEESGEQDPTSDEEQESDEKDEDTGDEGNRIPLSRLNKALAQRDAEKAQRETEQNRTAWLEKQLEELIAAKKLPPKDEVIEDPFDFAEAETKYIDLILEGDTTQAADLRAEIDAEKIILIREDIANNREETRGEIAAGKEQDLFDIAVDNFENKYPFMDINHKEYNEEAVDTTNALLTGFIADGKTSRADALAKAVKRVAPMYSKETKPKVDKKNSERNKETRKKNLKAMKQTPPKMRGKEKKDRDVEGVNAYDLSRKEYKSLTKKEKAVMRGDVV